MKLKITTVDAFTAKPFAGNPAAVCVLDQPVDEPTMQRVAAEMNLSETAFLLPKKDGFSLRWFTPTVEVELCGHATLASAHALWEQGFISPEREARFFTQKSGTLTARKNGNWIDLDFPNLPTEKTDPPAILADALRVNPLRVEKNSSNYLIEIGSQEDLQNMQPNFGLLETIKTHGFIVTSPAMMGKFDFVSRYFAPAFGVNEDPVTGSAHCSLAPYWGNKLEKKEMIACQISRRRGIVRMRLKEDRVDLCGQAVSVMQGEMTI